MKVLEEQVFQVLSLVFSRFLKKKKKKRQKKKKEKKKKKKKWSRSLLDRNFP